MHTNSGTGLVHWTVWIIYNQNYNQNYKSDKSIELAGFPITHSSSPLLHLSSNKENVHMEDLACLGKPIADFSGHQQSCSISPFHCSLSCYRLQSISLLQINLMEQKKHSSSPESLQHTHTQQRSTRCSWEGRKTAAAHLVLGWASIPSKNSTFEPGGATVCNNGYRQIYSPITWSNYTLKPAALWLPEVHYIQWEDVGLFRIYCWSISLDEHII